MIRDSFAHAEQDVGERLLVVEARGGGPHLAGDTRALAASADLLVEGERAAIEAAMGALEEVKAGRDHLAVRAAIQALDAASKDFATRRMNQRWRRGCAVRTSARWKAK